MTSYIVLLPGDESVWEKASEEERNAVFARHNQFSEALAGRGHKITGGAELAHSRAARVVRRGADGLTITEGPYAETVEQLSGFYLVETDDLDDLLDCTGILAESDAGIEVREMLLGSD
ncbi:MAG: YciI family protein [Actinomycetota bacterium]|nr:YciI family protein [Actinomycetota bacterium]